MALIQMQTAPPGVDREALRQELVHQIAGEVRFDALSRALYATDASVYQISPLGVVIPKNREDILADAGGLPPPQVSHHDAGRRHLAGRAGDRSGHPDRHVQISTTALWRRMRKRRWARVEPGIVLDELNAHLQPSAYASLRIFLPQAAPPSAE